MKNIAFVTDSLNVGGIEKALVELLNAIDHDRFNVYLFIPEYSGQFIESIHPRVKLICWNLNVRNGLIQDFSHLKLVPLCKKVFSRICAYKHRNDFHKNLYYSILCSPMYSDIHFECVIAYQINSPSVVASALAKLRSNKKIAFFHGKTAYPPCDLSFWDKVYSNFNVVFCVSNASREVFSSLYPRAGAVSQVMYNVIDADRIKHLANMEIPERKSHCTTSLLTVGRLSAEKGQDKIPFIARSLLDSGYDILWLIIGDGPLRTVILKEIEKYSVADHVCLLGTKSNPYPYIRQCDIYVQTSLSEGYCTTTVEAKILKKPIVTTPATGMCEQFTNMKNGLIVEDMEPSSILSGIRTVLDSQELQQRFIAALSNESIDNPNELAKLYHAIVS